MKPSNAFLAVLLSGLASTETEAWTLSTRVDAMTDKQESVVSVQSRDGAKFTLLRKSDNSVWGYLSLGGMNQFAVDQEILIRVDKHEPTDFRTHEKFYKIYSKANKIMNKRTVDDIDNIAIDIHNQVLRHTYNIFMAVGDPPSVKRDTKKFYDELRQYKCNFNNNKYVFKVVHEIIRQIFK